MRARLGYSLVRPFSITYARSKSTAERNRFKCRGVVPAITVITGNDSPWNRWQLQSVACFRQRVRDGRARTLGSILVVIWRSSRYTSTEASSLSHTACPRVQNILIFFLLFKPFQSSNNLSTGVIILFRAPTFR